MIESVGMMSDIYELEQIRRRISERYLSDPNIRINVSLRQPKRHALQYADVLTHDIELLDI